MAMADCGGADCGGDAGDDDDLREWPYACTCPPRLIFQSYVVTAMYIPIQFLKRELVKLRQSQSSV